MFAKSRNAGKNRILGRFFGRGRNAGRQTGFPPKRGRRNLQLEGLEKREMFAVSSLYLSGGALAVYTDNAATSVTVSQMGPNIRVTDDGANLFWDYAASQVGRVDFVGGAGNDRFINNVSNLATRAWGLGGDDYLEGYNNVDIFVGGDGNDTLVGYGGADQMWGQNGNDLLRGMNGADYLYGNAGNDHIDGGADNDKMWGGDGADILLGGTGDDEMYGENNNDRLNGQAGVDKMWGGENDDVLVAIDAAYNELVDSGNGADTMWIDNFRFLNLGYLRDSVVGASTSDVVQGVGSFANGADRTLDGDDITDPSDIDAKLAFTNTISAGNTHGSNPLFAESSSVGLSLYPRYTSSVSYFSGGPRTTDIAQGGLGDCWLLSGLGAIANQNANIIRQNVVDFDDGTYGVRLGNAFYRVDNELPVLDESYGAWSGNLRYASLGAQNSMWVAIVEKAFTYYRYGMNTYASIDGGWCGEVYNAFRLTNVGQTELSSYASAADMASDLYSKWTQGFALTVGPIAVDTGGYHAFTITSFVRDAVGTVTGIVLRNPWAYDGLNRFPAFASADGGTNEFDGYFTVSIDDFYNSGGSFDMARV
jgi:Ca2+-binding RTX toxin-like protein